MEQKQTNKKQQKTKNEKQQQRKNKKKSQRNTEKNFQMSRRTNFWKTNGRGISLSKTLSFNTFSLPNLQNKVTNFF